MSLARVPASAPTPALKLVTPPLGPRVRPGDRSVRGDATRILDAALTATRLTAAFRAGRTTGEQRARLARSIAERAKAASRLTAGHLVAADVGLDAWHRQTARGIAASHRAAAMALMGRRGLPPAGQAALDRLTDAQLEYLDAFAAQVRSGEQERDQSLVGRSGLYGAAAWAVAQGAVRAQAWADGMTEEASRLGPADHCRQCLEQAAVGWVSLGTLVPPGARLCRANCRCLLEFR